MWRAGRGTVAEAVAVPADLRLPAVTPPPGSGPFADRELPCFVRQAERFADLIEGAPAVAGPAPATFARSAAVAEPAPTAATFADGVAVQRVMDAARESDHDRRWVALG